MKSNAFKNAMFISTMLALGSVFQSLLGEHEVLSAHTFGGIIVGFTGSFSITYLLLSRPQHKEGQ